VRRGDDDLQLGAGDADGVVIDPPAAIDLHALVPTDDLWLWSACRVAEERADVVVEVARDRRKPAQSDIALAPLEHAQKRRGEAGSLSDVAERFAAAHAEPLDDLTDVRDALGVRGYVVCALRHGRGAYFVRRGVEQGGTR
jgi:hypothetical protein